MTLPLSSPRYVIQSAVFQALDGALSPDIRIVDMADSDTPCPFVDIGDSELQEGDDKTAETYALRMKIRIVCDVKDERGAKYASLIQEFIRNRLVNETLIVDGSWISNFVTCDAIGPVLRSEDLKYHVADLDLNFNFQKT